MTPTELDAIRATAAHWKEQAEQLQGELNTCKDDYIRVHGERNEALERWAEIQRASALWQANYEKTAERWRDAEGRLAEAHALLRQCLPSLKKDGRPHVVTMVQAAIGDITAVSAAVPPVYPHECICPTCGIRHGGGSNGESF